MKIDIVFFSNHRYWPDTNQLEEAIASLKISMEDVNGEFTFHHMNENDPALTSTAGIKILIPLSGAVQKQVLDVAASSQYVVILAAYVRNQFAPVEVTDRLLYANAAPTFMECWGIIRRNHEHAFYAISPTELRKRLRIIRADVATKDATILQIGDMEPWVQSPSRDLSIYKKHGFNVIHIDQEELLNRIKLISSQQANQLAETYELDAIERLEASRADLDVAAKLALALEHIAVEYEADAVALACFDLLAPTGTSACLGVSRLNTDKTLLVSCEGDLDSACTMLMVRHLTDDPLFMANPAIHADGTINFSHCTAPTSLKNHKLNYRLRNHHESGIGVSIESHYPVGIPLTLIRFSAIENQMLVLRGESIYGEREQSCRTQLNVRLEDFNKYMNNALGCHQVIAFEDILEDVQSLASLKGITVL